MPWNKPSQITLSEKQKKILEEFERGTHTPLHLKKRAKIVLLSNEGYSNNKIETQLGISAETVKLWRDKYSNNSVEINKIEQESPLKLRSIITKSLSDEQRSGAPPKFTDEQVAAIIALACEDPTKLGLPFSHWSPELLRIEAIKRNIVENISVSQIHRYLNEKDLKPDQVKGWLNPNIGDMDAFKKK